MDQYLKEVHPVKDYRLELVFRNGSRAVVNMEKRIHTLRFSRLTSKKLFMTAKAAGDRIVWSDGNEEFSVYVNDILDLMMMDN